jgi:hypothetical protein
MNFYSASVALLWLTAFRAGAVPAVPRQSHRQPIARTARTRIRPGGDGAGGASRASCPGPG